MTVPPPASALILGAGLMGRWHAHALRRLGVRVAGVVDLDIEQAQALARPFADGRAFDSIDEAIASVDASVAHVCTPLSSHVPLVTRTLDAGLHVIVEKPLATSYANTAGLLDLAEERGRVLCPVHQFMFQDGFVACQRMLLEAGPALHIDYVASSAGALGGQQPEAVVEDILPHPLSLMRRLLGDDFRSVTWSTPLGHPGEFRAIGESSSTTLGILITMRGRPTRNTLRVVCEGGTFHLDLYHGFVVREPPPVGRARKILRPFALAARSAFGASTHLLTRAARREPAYPGLRSLLRLFYGSPSGHRLAPISRSEILDVADVRDRFLERRHGRGS